MAKCNFCNQEMLNRNVVSCLANTEVEFSDGKILASIPYNPADSFKERRCGDCNIMAGGFHHPGCDMERCPRCNGQLISCGCLDLEDEYKPTSYLGQLRLLLIKPLIPSPLLVLS